MALTIAQIRTLMVIVLQGIQFGTLIHTKQNKVKPQVYIILPDLSNVQIRPVPYAMLAVDKRY